MTVHEATDVAKSPASESSPLLRSTSRTSAVPSHYGDDAEPPQAISKLRGAAIIVSFSVLIFLQSSNFSIMSTTSSPIAAELHAYSQASWFTSAYLIAMSSMSPLFGRLAQIFPPRYCVFVAGTLFAIGSLIVALANVLGVFLLGRAVQGVGAAGVLTLSIILVIYLTDKTRRGLFFGGVNSAVTVGVSLGAVIGGASVESIGWRTLFWIQAPLSFIAGVCLLFSIPKTDSVAEDQSLREKLKSIDYLGSLLLVGTLTSFLIGLSSPQILVLPILLAAALLTLFVLNEIYRASSPVIPISILSSRGALFSCFSQLGFMTTRWAVLFYTPIYTLAVRGWSPATAGSILIPTNAGFAAGGLLVGWLHIRRAGSFYAATLTCFVLFPITMFVLSRIVTPDSSSALLVVVVFVNGFIVGAALNYCLAHLLHLTRPDVHFVATSLLATFRGFSGSFGSGISGGVFSRLLQNSLEEGFAKRGIANTTDLVEQLLGSPALVYRLEGDRREVAVQGYSDAFSGLFLAGCGLAAVAVLVQAAAGWRGPGDAKDEGDAVERGGQDDGGP